MLTAASLEVGRVRQRGVSGAQAWQAFCCTPGSPHKTTPGWPVPHVGWTSGVRSAQRRGQGSPTFSSASSWRKSNGNWPTGGVGWGLDETLHIYTLSFILRPQPRPDTGTHLHLLSSLSINVLYFCRDSLPIFSHLLPVIFWGVCVCVLTVPFYPLQFYCCN